MKSKVFKTYHKNSEILYRKIAQFCSPKNLTFQLKKLRNQRAKNFKDYLFISLENYKINIAPKISVQNASFNI